MDEQPPDTRPREEGRPDPEELLRRYGLSDSDLTAASPPVTPAGNERATPGTGAGRYPHRRGRLRVYLAAAAGAGKTYAMLNEGHRRESRGTDVVASITGVRVRETLPDWILDQADEVELIDISPHALRQRMKHGNIYPPERVDAALNHFFREGNLTALRELALRRTAEKTEEQL